MIPQPKFSVFIEQLNNIARHVNRTKYIFDLKTIEKEAEKILNIDSVQGNILLGAIASLQNRITDLHKFHKKALFESTNSKFALLQYAISLSNANLNDDAYDYFKKAYAGGEIDLSSEDDIHILRCLMEFSYHRNDNDSYEKYKSILLKLNIDFPDPDDFIEDDMDVLDSMLSKADVLMDENPHLIVKPDQKLLTRIEKLIAGIEVS